MRFLPTRQRQEQALQPQITAFQSLWSEAYASGLGYSPRLVDRVWAANRSTQLNSQEISSMPLRFTGTREPTWVTNPDPVWYPNGIRDAIFSIVWSLYTWGDAFLYVTNRYADGFPASWTVLGADRMNVQIEDGRRVFRSGAMPLDEEDVVQITRDPRGSLRGTPALSPYAGAAWGLLAAGELSRVMTAGGGIPNAVLKSRRKLLAGQAQAIQEQWMAARARSAIGAPAVLDDGLDLEQLQFSPTDLSLIDVQQLYARVVASAYGVPPFLLNLPLEGGLTYQNPEMLIEQWWRGELRPMAGNIAAALSGQMLPRGSVVQFDSQEALAPAWRDLVSAGLDMVKEGAMSIDEFRVAVLHLPPASEGDALDELSMPPTASVSPAQQPDAIVQELRPAVMIS